MATQPQQSERRPLNREDIARWRRRLREAAAVRRQQERQVWKPLYEAVQSRLGRGADGDKHPELVNAVREFESVLLPHIVGDRRQCKVTVRRLSPGEDAQAKLALADELGVQATALAEAVGFSSGTEAAPSQWYRAARNAGWGMGVLMFGFTAPEAEVGNGEQGTGNREQGTENRATPAGFSAPLPGDDPERGGLAPGQQTDPYLARGGYEERADAGMPWVRSLDPRRVLVDPTHNDLHKADWYAVEETLTLADARKLYPRHARRLAATHRRAPGWDGGDDEAGQDQEKRLVLINRIFLRRPQREIVLAHEGAGVDDEPLDTRDLDFGLEGPPFVFLGGAWLEGKLYPEPLLADGYDAARLENEQLVTIAASAAKIKNLTFVNGKEQPGLAEQIAAGTSNGVYLLDTARDIRELVANIDAGGVRQEHRQVAEIAREAAQRTTGMGDMQLGVREPGDQRVRQIAAREEGATARLAGKLLLVRAAEAQAYQMLIAIAFAKLELMHGLRFVLESGSPFERFAAFDAARPLIGELTSYKFVVSVADRLRTIEQVDQLQELIDRVAGLAPQLASEGRMARVAPLLERVLLLRDVDNVDEILPPLPPPPPVDPQTGQPVSDPAGGNELGADPAALGGAVPPAPPMPDAGGAVLNTAPGSPDEEQALLLLAQQAGV